MKIAKQLLTALVVPMFLVSCQDHTGPGIIARRGILLTGAQEVPAKMGPGSGTVDVSYDKTSHVLSYTLTWMGLTGDATGAHIHGPAPRGVNAPIKHDFFRLITKTSSGTFSNSTVVDGTELTEDNLLNGQYYFNMHTAMNPGGEIRGQVEF